MAQLDAAVFKLGQGAIVGLGRVTCACGVVQQGFCAQHLQNLLGIGLPVGGAVQVAAGFETGGQLGNQRGLNQAAFVVLFLVPRVGEENMHAVQAGHVACGQHVINDFNRVVLQDADVAQALLVNAFEQRAYAGRVDLAAQEVFARHHAGNVRCGLTHAKADFQNGGCCAVEDDCKIHQRGAVGQQELWPYSSKGPGLAGCGAAGSHHKAADGAVVSSIARCGWAGIHRL